MCRAEVGGRVGQRTAGMRMLMVGESASMRIMILMLLLLVAVVMALVLEGLGHSHGHAEAIVAGAVQQTMLISAMILVEHGVGIGYSLQAGSAGRRGSFKVEG